MPKERPKVVKVVKMSAAELRRLALTALVYAETFWSDPRRRMEVGEWRFTVDAQGEMLVEYDTGDGCGLGRVSCSYYPLPAIEKVAAEFERDVNHFIIHEEGQDPVALAAVTPAEQRERTVASMTETFAVLFVGQLGLNLLDALRESYLDAAVFTQLGLRNVLVGIYQREDRQLEKPDMNAVKARLVDEAAESHRARLNELMRQWKSIAPRGVGRQYAVETPAVVALLREHGRVSQARAKVLLGCHEDSIKAWAKRRPEKTWAKARDALLERLGKGGTIQR